MDSPSMLISGALPEIRSAITDIGSSAALTASCERFASTLAWAYWQVPENSLRLAQPQPPASLRQYCGGVKRREFLRGLVDDAGQVACQWRHAAVDPHDIRHVDHELLAGDPGPRVLPTRSQVPGQRVEACRDQPCCLSSSGLLASAQGWRPAAAKAPPGHCPRWHATCTSGTS